MALPKHFERKKKKDLFARQISQLYRCSQVAIMGRTLQRRFVIATGMIQLTKERLRCSVLKEVNDNLERTAVGAWEQWKPISI